MPNDFINVVDPDTGQIGSIPAAQAQAAASQGYVPASDAQVQQAKLQDTYGTGVQATIAELEGAASGATLGLSTALERAAGVSPQDIAARRIANPGWHALGQGLGLGLSTAASLGAAPALSAAGEAAGLGAEALIGTGAAGRIGSALTRGAVENAMFQSGDEVSKMLASDPEQSASTAAANIGLSGLIGGGLGAGLGGVSELWSATHGGATTGVLNALTNHLGGADVVAPDIQDALGKLGIEVPPEIRANLAADPEIAGMAKQLEQTDTSRAGRDFQDTLKNFKRGIGERLAGMFGKTPDEVGALSELSKAEAGKNIGGKLADEFEAKAGPLSAEYDNLRNRFNGVKLRQTVPGLPAEGDFPGSPAIPGHVAEMADSIAQLAQREGWAISPSSDIMREVNRVITELPNVKTLNELGDYIKAVGNNMQSDPLNGPLNRAGGLIKSVLRDTEGRIIQENLAEQAPELLANYDRLTPAYKAVSEIKDAVDARLHTRASTAGFASAVRDMASESPEKLLQRISGTNDADMLSTLEQHFPATARALKDYHINNTLKAAAQAAKGEDVINTAALLRQMERMSPEMRHFVLPEGGAQTLAAADAVLSQFNSLPHNFSNTARTLHKLTGGLPGSAAAIATLLTGHGIGAAFAAKTLGGAFAREAPDALRLALLKFLGSSEPISANGFAGMVNYVSRVLKGEAAINRGVKAVFDISSKTLPTLAVDQRDVDRVNKLVEELPPEQLTRLGGYSGHYLPDHAAAIGNITGTVLQALSAAKPALVRQAPLDPEPEPTPQQMAVYHRAISMAEQPLAILHTVAQGAISQQDVQMFSSMYPGLYQRLSAKLLSQLTDVASEGEAIPYKLRMGLATFLQQPLDSSMFPQAIAANQAALAPPPAPPQQAVRPSKTGMNKIKESQMAMLPSQAAAAKKQA